MKWGKKTLIETQILRAGRSKAEPKIFATQDGQNLISWSYNICRWSSPTNPVWWR